jgi:hypothetical protein
MQRSTCRNLRWQDYMVHIWNGHYESMSFLFVFFSKKYELNFILLFTLDEIFPGGIEHIELFRCADAHISVTMHKKYFNHVTKIFHPLKFVWNMYQIYMHTFFIYFKKFSYYIFLSCHTNIWPPQICMKYVLNILKYNSSYTSKKLLTKYVSTSHMILSTSHMILDNALLGPVWCKYFTQSSLHIDVSIIS